MEPAQIPGPMAPCLTLETHHYATDQGSALAYGRSPLLRHNKHTRYRLQTAHAHYEQGLCEHCGT